MLLEHGADANAQDDKGTALQAAAYGSNEKVVKKLLDSGADVNARGVEYGTALNAGAASCENEEKVKELLLGCAANIDAQDGIHGNCL